MKSVNTASSTAYDARPAPLIIKIGIATTGRADTLSDTLAQIGRQRRLPDELIVCPASPSDCHEDRLAGLPYPTRIVRSQRGSVPQRNAIIVDAGRCDVMVFLDDDFYPSTDYLERLETLFQSERDIVGVTGHVIVDAATTEALEHEEALQILAQHAAATPAAALLSPVYNLYGCNMSVRMDVVERHGLLFDQNLPLYGWLEDLDFTRQVGAHGRLVKAHSLTGVHLATKRGRSSGIRFGYSQVANPLYLMQKGTMTPVRALRQIGRNVSANAYHCLTPEPWLDRRGRLRGNVIAALDLLRGRLDPKNILELDV